MYKLYKMLKMSLMLTPSTSSLGKIQSTLIVYCGVLELESNCNVIVTDNECNVIVIVIVMENLK